MKPPAMQPDARVVTLADLARTLGGDANSFTADLLRLIAKADPGSRARLAAVYPGQVAAWQMWMAREEGGWTCAELRAIADGAEADGSTWAVVAARPPEP